MAAIVCLAKPCAAGTVAPHLQTQRKTPASIKLAGVFLWLHYDPEGTRTLDLRRDRLNALLILLYAIKGMRAAYLILDGTFLAHLF